MQMHMNFTYLDIRMMPTRYRHWYIKRLVQHFEKRSSMYEKARNPSSDASSSNMESLDKFTDMMNKKFS